MNKSGFNPKARWDRRIPETGNPDKEQDLNERIEVLARFKNAKIYPEIFTWKNKEYRIEKITYNWQERFGAETINYFSVITESQSLYQISFSNTDYTWKINKIISA